MTQASGQDASFDVVVVGAGFSGLYLLHRLRQAGFSTLVVDAAGDVGGTWYWNRYPGARCDIQTMDYSYTFDPELDRAWSWSEKYATQPEILRYLNFVADRYDLRSDIRFNTRVTEAAWDESAQRWRLNIDDDTSDGGKLSCRYYVMATGCLSSPKPPEIDGAAAFKGATYLTGRWPHEGVDFTGQRVAVIGTGSSGIQAIPLIAEQAAQLTVFQRSASYALPARNGAPDAGRLAARRQDRAAYVEQARGSLAGVPFAPLSIASWQLSEAERRARFEQAWQAGDLVGWLTQLWADQGSDLEGNALTCELLVEKIRATVQDPATADALTPRNLPFGAKRPCLDTGYYETYNRPNVTLVDLREEPIQRITATGIQTARRHVELDAIVFATGFDAMTGAMLAVHPIAGRGGRTLAEAWAEGPRSYLGLTVAGFPNLFMITGPGSPSVLSNMMVSIEQHVDWVVDRLIALREAGFTTIEATEAAQAGWSRHQHDCLGLTLHRLAGTWYTGANVAGKAQGLMPYNGGVGLYRALCNAVVEQGLLGFRLSGPGGAEQCNDGEIARLQPDVQIVLSMLEQAGLPPLESLGAAGARAVLTQLNQGRPAGRPIGAVVDGSLPGAVQDGALSGAGGPLRYRLYRPASPGPHPVLVYFHGGGWVLGDEASDDPFCHDLCRRADMVVVSVGYRHAPEHPFPAAAEDGYAAARWIGEHLAELGGRPGPLLVAGWSAGGNVAAVTCQLARDRGGPDIAGQLLVCPVTDCDVEHPSYAHNADGYFLTRSLMQWFRDSYCPPEQRGDARASPLRGRLQGLPPAFIATAEFDPLRDEGEAYARALEAAGVPVELLQGPGQMHASYTMVDVITTANAARSRMARALRAFAGLPVEPAAPGDAPAPRRTEAATAG